MSEIRVAMTCGDPLGVGPEVGVVAAAAAPCEVVLVGPRALWGRAAALRGLDPGDLQIVEPPGAGPVEVVAIDAAVSGALAGRWDAVCTMPIHKADLQAGGFRWSGHTPYLAHLCGRPEHEAVMVFAGGELSVSLATVHLPLADVPGALSPEAVERAGRGLVDVLRRRGVAAPALAVCGLNPHAGEEGTLGLEDERVVRPGIAALREVGIDASGPHPADTVFARAAGGEFDGVVAMYHDQGLTPVKTLDFSRSVNITAGLPIVRTSVDHGTARDIAWTGRADARHAVAAVAMAAELVG